MRSGIIPETVDPIGAQALPGRMVFRPSQAQWTIASSAYIPKIVSMSPAR